MKFFLVVLMTVLFIGGMGGIAYAVNYDIGWEAPTINEDGSDLTDLGGYFLYNNGVKITDVGNVLSYKYNVPEGDNVITIRAYDTSGNESIDSNPLTINIKVCPGPPLNATATKSSP